MSDIKVLGVLMQCVGDLLSCNDLPTERMIFDELEQCRARLTTMLAERETRIDSVTFVVGQCRFILAEPIAAEEPPGAMAAPGVE